MIDDRSTGDVGRVTGPRPTTLLAVPASVSPTGKTLALASETFQHTGSFKFRAAHSVASRVPARHLITASSGNFGQALAFACALLGKRCRVVMPDTSAEVKIAAVRRHGAEVELIDVRRVGRLERLAELAREFPDAYVASPYDDEHVIEGNASLGRELAAFDYDDVVVPVGGGGLISGVLTGLGPKSGAVVGAEPLLANDAARSLREGRLVRNEAEPATIADGARTLSLGARNWEIVRRGLQRIVEVPEEAIAEGLRFLFLHANLKAEPTGAVAFGAVLASPEMFRGRSVCCVVSGGNVDPEIYARLLRG